MFINYGMQIAPSTKFVMSCSTTPPPGLEGGPAVLKQKEEQSTHKEENLLLGPSRLSE